MEWHRHRIHPVLWSALGPLQSRDPVRRELESWKAKREVCLARRPEFSPTKMRPPWLRPDLRSLT